MKNTKTSFLFSKEKWALLCLFILLIMGGCFKARHSDKAAEKMQHFVQDIAYYAHSINPSFEIIPQNGVELAFNNTDISDGVNTDYIAAVSGFGVEELFYSDIAETDYERLDMLRELKNHHPVLVSDYVGNNSDVSSAISLNTGNGFICFPRVASNYDYLQIPDSAIQENTTNITTLSDARNYLYLISTDNYSDKNTMITAIQNTNFDAVLIDLFFNDVALTSSDIDLLKTKSNGATRRVYAYINIGAAEKWRYYYHSKWKLHHPCWLKKKYPGYDDEILVKFWNEEWQDIIFGNNDSYMKKILNAGFDGAYLDNVETYYFLYYKD